MTLDEILARIVEGAKRTLQADAATLRLLDEEGTRLNVEATAGALPLFRRCRAVGVERSPLDEEALSGGRPTIATDARIDPRALGVPKSCRSVLCVPLIHQGTPLGTLHVYATGSKRFGEEDAALLVPLAELGAAAIAATRALTSLRNLEASRTRFIQVATHELRSPVAVAQSLVRGVLKGYAGELTERQVEPLQRISRRLEFLERLVNDLLDLAAGRAPELAEEERAVAVNSSVGRAVLLIQPRAEEKEVALTLRPCCEELVVWGTEEGLDRIFVNLVDNAVKYTPPSGSVTVSLRRAKEEIWVRITDTGIGIPEEALPHLFEEFYRAPNAKALDAAGTGLGLTIVKELVDRYGGHIEVESEAGRGSTFSVAFPVYNLPEVA